MKTAVVIPCRWGSSRFPGKPLARILNKPVIQHVYERATCSKEASRVIVATDDPRIEEAVRLFGGEAVLTSTESRTGTDRMAELIETVEADAFVNLQADELILDAMILDELIAGFRSEQPCEIGTLKQVIEDSNELVNPNVVKVVTDQEGWALYFSRSPIPFIRDRNEKGKAPRAEPGAYFKHLGIYIYQKEVLRQYALLPTTILERFEKLEQLRALERGYKIRVWQTHRESLRIDTREDLESAEQRLSGGS